MHYTKFSILILLLFFSTKVNAQNFNFDFNNNGKRVCLVTSQVNITNNSVTVLFLDSLANTTSTTAVLRRQFGTSNWTIMVNNLSAGTGHWIDNNVAQGQVWEYQIKRQNTWTYGGNNYDAIGYTMASLLTDNTNYKGQIILLVASDVPTNLATKYNRLKKEITADGYFVKEIITPRATNWDSGNEVVTIKNKIKTIYTNAPIADKPKLIFILGHVPLPRSGSTTVTAPDEHNENKGARGCDAYYADIDGVYTDTAIFNPGGLATPLAINIPGDFKWDQDFFPLDIEMAFGRVDFADITDVSTSETILLENYLDRLSNYKNVTTGCNMGDKTAFHFGYDNSNDGSYRCLPNISTVNNVYQNYTGAIHNQWVQNNGPFKMYMQNVSVPEIADWQTYGMNATVYTSDQSYWGFGDVPQANTIYSRIRALLAVPSKCLVTLWTTTGVNMFHQSCTGSSFGESVKMIMNHNNANQYLPKPPQDYDTEAWWNRTHFAYYGDPSINLYQIMPPSNASINAVGNDAVLQWSNSLDAKLIGYHIYESDSAVGKFTRISTSIITGNTFTIPNYQFGKWYMVKAVASVTSGCGKFLQASLGKEVQGNIALSIGKNTLQENTLQVYPNPATNIIYIYNFNFTDKSIATITNVDSKVIVSKTLTNNSIDIADLQNGIYFLQIIQGGKMYKGKIVKE
jgi:hypothetical protein